MTTFLFVGWAWYYQTVARLLERAGHRVHRLSLTGHGERAHLASPAVGLETHVLDIVNYLEYEDLHDVVLVGWSYSGVPATGAAERVPNRLRHLVYLDGCAPVSGQSILDVMRAYTPDTAAEMEARVQRDGEGWRVPLSPEADPRATPTLWATWTQSLDLGDPPAASVPKTYVRCTQKPEPMATLWAGAEGDGRIEGMTVIDLDAPHNWTVAPYVEEAAALLLRLFAE
jgi:pimeloyl-ACP methyl ester carboxylesterase